MSFSPFFLLVFSARFPLFYNFSEKDFKFVQIDTFVFFEAEQIFSTLVNISSTAGVMH